MTRRTASVAGIAVLALIAVAIVLTLRTRTTATNTADPPSSAPAVTLATARFGVLTTRVTAPGRVGVPAGGDAKLSFAGSGIVARVDTSVGRSVVAGEALAELDTGGLAIDAAQARADAAAAAASYGGGAVPAQALAGAQQRLTAARNRLNALQHGTGTAQSDAIGAQDAYRQAQAKVAADERTLEREQTLFTGGVAAQKDVEAARQQLALDRADLDAARAKAGSASSGIGGALAQARADVAQAETDVRNAQAQTGVTAAQAGSAAARFAAAQRNLANAVLRAPADGVVVAILKHPGESVDPTTPAIVVGPPSSNVVTVTVTGDAARQIRPGAPSSVTVGARGLRGAAVVRSVVPSVDPTTQTSTVVLSGAPRGSASGDAIEATIDLARHRGVVIPSDAIVEDPQSGHAVVFVRSRGKDAGDAFTSRQIITGATDGTSTIVEAGLRAGEQIAAHGAFDLLAPSGG